MSDTRIENAICQAINILTNKKIGQAPFDRTIRATVVGKGNDGALSYRVKGEGTSQMLVYSNSPDIDYPVGSIVYVLIPAGNTDRDKYIVGSGAKQINQYKDIINTSNVNYIGQDLITRCGQYSLNSYKKNGDELILYPSNENNHFYVDNSIGQLSINQAQTIQLSSNIRTAFSDTQVGGTYGVEVVLKFQYKNKDTENIVQNIKTYVLNQEDVIGNPFKQKTGQKVSTVFDIVGEGTFVSVEKIRLFIKQEFLKGK